MGFIVNERGIEASPEKIVALVYMQPPTYIRDVQRLNGRITTLGRFIAKSAKRSLLFFKILKGSQSFS